MVVRVLLGGIMLFFLTIASAGEIYTLARAPQLSPAAISKTWTPFVRYLSDKTGVTIELKVYDERSMFERDIRAGKVDFYFGNPGYAVVGHLRHGYVPLIRSDRKLLEGIIVTRVDSPVKNIEELEGREIAFPSKTAFAASLYIRSRLDADLGLTYEPVYTGSHDNTYRAVLIGKVPAGGGVIRTLEQEPVALREKLRVLYTTPGLKSHPLMAKPTVPVTTREAVRQAILDLDKDDSGRKLLKSIKLQKPVSASYENDYRSIEKLAIRMYDYMLD